MFVNGTKIWWWFIFNWLLYFYILTSLLPLKNRGAATTSASMDQPLFDTKFVALTICKPVLTVLTFEGMESWRMQMEAAIVAY